MISERAVFQMFFLICFDHVAKIRFLRVMILLKNDERIVIL